MTKEQRAIIDIIGAEYSETSTGEVYTTCPFCDDHRKKLYISPDGKFICFLCETRGLSVYSFIMQYYHVSYQEAKDMLKYDDFGTPDTTPIDDETLLTKLVSLKDKQQQPRIDKTCPTLPTNTKLLKDNLNNPSAYPYLWYIKKRGITLEQIYKYQLGYVIDGKVFNKDKELTINNSIIFPTFNSKGEMIYWSTRSIEDHPFIKSFNALARENEYSRKDIVFNLNNVKNKIVICEGIFNAISSTVGDYIGVATLGKAITDNQIDLMVKANPQDYYIFLDNDAMKQELELIQRLNNRGIGSEHIYLVLNPYGNKDANDLGGIIVKGLLDKAQPVNLQSMLYLVRGE